MAGEGELWILMDRYVIPYIENSGERGRSPEDIRFFVFGHPRLGLKAQGMVHDWLKSRIWAKHKLYRRADGRIIIVPPPKAVETIRNRDLLG